MTITATVELTVTLEAPSAAVAVRQLLGAYGPATVRAELAETGEMLAHEILARRVTLRRPPAPGKGAHG